MRVLALIVFLLATFWCWDALLTFTQLTPDEMIFMASPADARLQSQAETAREARIFSAAKSAFASASLFTIGVVLLLRKYFFERTRFGPAHVPDLEALLENVKRHPSTAPPHATHFYESRRARCRAARERLQSKVAILFGFGTPS
jgi:hypothetical protein